MSLSGRLYKKEVKPQIIWWQWLYTFSRRHWGCSILNVDSPIESWIFYSGASFHLSPNKELFQNFNSGSFEEMYLANNKDLKIEGKGDVYLKTPAENQWTLKDIRYIPSLNKNLISISQSDSTGYATKFGKSSWKIVKGAMVFALGTKSETLYTTARCMNMAVVSESASNSRL